MTCQWCQREAETSKVAQLDVCAECTPIVVKQRDSPVMYRRMMKGKWRSRSEAAVTKILDEHPGVGSVELRAILSKAYPFGQRKYWPYKVWLDVVRTTVEARQ